MCIYKIYFPNLSKQIILFLKSRYKKTLIKLFPGIASKIFIFEFIKYGQKVPKTTLATLKHFLHSNISVKHFIVFYFPFCIVSRKYSKNIKVQLSKMFYRNKLFNVEKICWQKCAFLFVHMLASILP